MKASGRLRVGIVGMGNAGMMHARSLMEGAAPRAELAAVCDSASRLESLGASIPSSVRRFESFDSMTGSGSVDAVIVATPHPQHPELCEKALAAGLHVFCEKPAGVSVSDVRRLNAVAAKSSKVFTMHFNKRLEPVYMKLKALIESGELGRLMRVNWITTSWFRTQAYFDSASWRGTWAGEGGGLLINQCIHELDIWQRLFGTPSRLMAFCSFGRHHEIEVEDEATVYMEYAGGFNGVLVASSGESPGTNRLEIACSRGTLVAEGKRLSFRRALEPVDVFCRSCPKIFGEPESWSCEIPVSGQADLSGGVLRNFLEAALDGAPLLVRGEEGLASLEMENAILLSAWTGSWASLPADGARFDAELARRVASSKGKARKVSASFADLKESFK